MKVLLDTCILSEIRKPKGNPNVIRAVQNEKNDDLFISIITFGEILKGITLLDQGKRRHGLENWLQGLEHYYTNKILNIDLETTHIWGEMIAKAQKNGRTISTCDGLIAATARKYGLHIMTRNAQDFEPTGVLLINPWEE
jgi:predicted nucleic acid-binding protein